jgi:hypothetical protein
LAVSWGVNPDCLLWYWVVFGLQEFDLGVFEVGLWDEEVDWWKVSLAEKVYQWQLASLISTSVDWREV